MTVVGAGRLAASVVAVLGVLGPAMASAAGYDVPVAAHSPVLDMDLSDAVWKNSLRATAFTDYQTKSPAPPTTRAYLIADDRNLYVAFVCERNGRPNISSNVNDLRAQSVDFVEFDLDPSGNGNRVYRFLATPNQLQTQFSSESSRYYPRWSAQGLVEPDRYVVELVVPYKAMKLGRDALTNARVNFIRHVASSGADYTWAYDPRVTDLHADTRYWPVVRGLKPSAAALKPDPAADFYVLDTAGADRDRFTSPVGGLRARNTRIAGVDVTYPFTSTISLVGTVAPDFSNVDIDQTTIAPQRFPFHYTEYRPFFARGQQYVDPLPYSGIAQTTADLFYTPRLAFLDSGLKIEGTTGQSAFGVLEAKGEGFHDAAVGYQLSSSDRSRQFAVQAVSANRPGIADKSAGVSYNVQNQKSGVFANIEYLIDRNPFVTSTAVANASLAAVGIHNGTWLAETGFQSVGPEFAPVDGFVSSSDIRGPFVYVNYSRPTKGLRQFALTGSVDRFKGWNGADSESDALLSAFFQTRSLTSFSLTTSTTEIAAYANPYPAYTGRDDVVFNQTTLALAFGTGTARSIDLSYGFGPFAIGCGGSRSNVCADAGPSGYAHAFLQQPGLLLSRQLSAEYTVFVQYAGSIERSTSSARSDSQWLRRVGLSRAIGKRGSVGISLRTISGRGGNATPGTNLSGLLDLQTGRLDHLYAEFGSPSANRTLNRALLKYVFHVGGGAGI